MCVFYVQFISCKPNRQVMRMVDINITEISETSLASTLLTIGVQLCAARKEAGRSVADVANELRINAGYLNAIEKGELDALDRKSVV